MSRGRVLIVDDDPLLLRVLHLALETEGYEVLLASDGDTALKRMRERPDVVLLDVMMPLLDGWGVLERMRGMEQRPRMVALTGKVGRRDEIRAWQLGVDEYVIKPFDTEKLLGLIRDLVERTPDEQAKRRDEALRALGVPADQEL
ncbi:MAG TPA: response regulator transcription factor [Actinomycetota bacterium]|nr:response regulator transcription factor [Actinomycetota bacterium]